jgi:uncharacterized protein (TIGR03000 family)
MFRVPSLLGIAAVGLTLLFAQESFAQKGGARGGGGGGAARAAPRAAVAPRPATQAIRPATQSMVRPATQAIRPANAVNPGVSRIAPNAQVLPRGNVAPGTLARNGVPLHAGINDARFLHNQNAAFNHHHFARNNFFFISPGWGLFGWGLGGWGLGGWGYPSYDYGLGYGLGYGGGLPYYDYGNYSLPPTYAFGGSFGGPSIAAPPTTEMGVQLDVFVPDPNAVVWFDGQQTASQGMTRYFDSPPLPPGREFTYTIKAAWTDRGQSVVQERVVTVRAGSRIVVDFRQWPFDGQD